MEPTTCSLCDSIAKWRVVFPTWAQDLCQSHFRNTNYATFPQQPTRTELLPQCKSKT